MATSALAEQGFTELLPNEIEATKSASRATLFSVLFKVIVIALLSSIAISLWQINQRQADQEHHSEWQKQNGLTKN